MNSTSVKMSNYKLFNASDVTVSYEFFNAFKRILDDFYVSYPSNSYIVISNPLKNSAIIEVVEGVIRKLDIATVLISLYWFFFTFVLMKYLGNTGLYFGIIMYILAML